MGSRQTGGFARVLATRPLWCPVLAVLAACPGSCSKQRAGFTGSVDGKAVSFEWHSVLLDRIPVYQKGFRSGRLEPLKALDRGTMEKIREELPRKPLRFHYKPVIKISDAARRRAVEKLALKFGISMADADDALPPAAAWEASVGDTRVTAPVIRNSPHLLEEYLGFAWDLPFQSVSCDADMLFGFLDEQARFMRQSGTFVKMVKPQWAYVIRSKEEPEEIMLIVLPEDPGWEEVDAFHKSKR